MSEEHSITCIKNTNQFMHHTVPSTTPTVEDTERERARMRRFKEATQLDRW